MNLSFLSFEMNKSINNKKEKIIYADDNYEPIHTLFKLRLPALVIWLILGIGISFVTSRFEAVLEKNVQVAFFLPFIVYIADAIGTQTETIYSRNLKTGKAKFGHYLHKETVLGIVFGILFGLISGAIALVRLHNELLAISVGIATFSAIAIAPIVALIVTHIFQRLHRDPAASSGPVTTVIQDMTSVIIYGVVCSLIIL